MSERLAIAPAAGPASSARGVAGTPADLFVRLEERVVQLVERHREAQKALAELEGRLREANARASRLEHDLAERDVLREQLRARLEQAIEWVRALEGAAAAVGRSAEGSADGEDC